MKKVINKIIAINIIFFFFSKMACAGIYTVAINSSNHDHRFDTSGFIGEKATAQYTVTNSSGTSTPFPITISYSATQDDFPAGMTIASGSTCQNGTPLAVGQSCTLNLEFTPAASGVYSGGPVISYKHLYGSQPADGDRINVTVAPVPPNALAEVESESGDTLYAFTTPPVGINSSLLPTTSTKTPAPDASNSLFLSRLFSKHPEKNVNVNDGNDTSSVAEPTVRALDSTHLTVQNVSNAPLGNLSLTISHPPLKGTLAVSSEETATPSRGRFLSGLLKLFSTDTVPACSSVGRLNPGQKCYFSVRYTAEATTLPDPTKIQGYTAEATVKYGGGGDGIKFPLAVYHVNNGYFLPLPLSASLYRAIGNNNIHSVFVDSAGKIYLATYSGLSIGGYNSNGDGKMYFTQRTRANGLGSDDVRKVFVDSIGKIYAATANGLSFSTDGGKTFSNVVHGGTGTIADNDVRDVFVVNSAGKTYIYAATTSGLSFSTDGLVTFITRSTSDTGHPLVNNNVYGVFSDGSKVYVATHGGISVSSDLDCSSFSNSTHTNTSFPDQLASDIVNAVYVYNGKLYAATSPKTGDTAQQGGLSISSDLTSSPLKFTTKSWLGNKLGSDDVRSVYVTSVNGTDRIYVSTVPIQSLGESGGFSISQAPKQDGSFNFDNKTVVANHLGSNTVTGVAVDSVGKIYAATTAVSAAQPGGLSVSSDGGNTFTNTKTDQNLGSLQANNVFIDTNGVIYVATEPYSMPLSDTMVLPINFFGGLSISSDGGSTFTTKGVSDGLGSNDVKSIFTFIYPYDNSINVYAGTANGLGFSSNGGLFSNYQSNKDIRGVALQNTDEVYIATDKGVGYTFNGVSGPFTFLDLPDHNLDARAMFADIGGHEYIYFGMKSSGTLTGGVYYGSVHGTIYHIVPTCDVYGITVSNDNIFAAAQCTSGSGHVGSSLITFDLFVNTTHFYDVTNNHLGSGKALHVFVNNLPNPPQVYVATTPDASGVGGLSICKAFNLGIAGNQFVNYGYSSANLGSNDARGVYFYKGMVFAATAPQIITLPSTYYPGGLSVTVPVP